MKYFDKGGIMDAVLFLVGLAVGGTVFSFFSVLPTIGVIIVGFVLVVVGFSIDGYIGSFVVGIGAGAASGLIGYIESAVSGSSGAS